MAIIIETLEQQGMVEMVRLDRKLYLNADKTKALEDGDPDAAFLYGVEGHLVPRSEAARLGALPRPQEEEVGATVKARARKALAKPEGEEEA